VSSYIRGSNFVGGPGSRLQRGDHVSIQKKPDCVRVESDCTKRELPKRGRDLRSPADWSGAVGSSPKRGGGRLESIEICMGQTSKKSHALFVGNSMGGKRVLKDQIFNHFTALWETAEKKGEGGAD